MKLKGIERVGRKLAGVFGAPVRSSGGVPSRRKRSGAGRPSGTYKTRALPDGSIVKVSTSEYNKLRTAQVREMRLQREVRQARLAAQVMPDHVRQPGAEDAWLMAEDFTPQQQMGGYPQEMMEEQQQQGPGVLDRLRNRLAGRRGFGGGQGGYGYGGAPMGSQGPLIQGPVERPPMSAGLGTPRLDIWGGPSSILHTGTKLNQPGSTEVRP